MQAGRAGPTRLILLGLILLALALAVLFGTTGLVIGVVLVLIGYGAAAWLLPRRRP
jgi:hypothetical protein